MLEKTTRRHTSEIGAKWACAAKNYKQDVSRELQVRYAEALDQIENDLRRAPKKFSLCDFDCGFWEPPSGNLDRHARAFVVLSRQLIAMCERAKLGLPLRRNPIRLSARISTNEAQVLARAAERVSRGLRKFPLDGITALEATQPWLASRKMSEFRSADPNSCQLSAYQLSIGPQTLADALDAFAGALKTLPRVKRKAGGRGHQLSEIVALAAALAGYIRIATGAKYSYQLGDCWPGKKGDGGCPCWKSVALFVGLALGKEVDAIDLQNRVDKLSDGTRTHIATMTP